MAGDARPDGRKKKRPGVADQRKRIGEISVQLMLEQGTRELSISKICQQADISRPTFYRCFKDLDDLFGWLYQSSVNEHTEALIFECFRSERASSEDLHRAIDLLFDAIFEGSDLAELIFRESNDESSPAFAVVDESFERILDVIEARMPGGDASQRRYLKSILAACQWIAHDTIRTGLSKKNIKEAKQAAWMLVSHALLPLVEAAD